MGYVGTFERSRTVKKIKVLIGCLAIVYAPINVCAAESFSETIIGENFSSDDVTSELSNDSSFDSGTSLNNIANELSGSSSDLSDSMSLDSLSSTKESETNSQSVDIQTEKSDLQKYQDAFDQSRTIMKDGLPTLETESMDNLRSQLTDSVKANAASTLEELMGDSFTGLDTNLFNISGMPSSESFSTESLNVHYAEMLKEFEKASSGISENLNHKINGNKSFIGNIDTELENWRNSDSYKTISSKISLADVFGSLDNKLPDKKSGTDSLSYKTNVATQNSKIATEEKKTLTSVKKEQNKDLAAGSSKLKKAANAWANNKKKNPVTGKNYK